jgi:tetratricopeptide (TPR) repeat protein
MERGSIEGEVFHRGAVAVLSPDLVRTDVESHLTTLVRKELIRSTASTFPQDEGYRFRHLLIRDAAYESLPKATRAELHEQFADWLSTHDLVEGDEIVGYHLEQAHRYRSELDSGDESLPDLASRASSRLAAAGRGALDRADFYAGRSLLRRASAVLPIGDERRLALLPELAVALNESGEGDEAAQVLNEASGAESELTRARAAVTRAFLRQQPVEGGDSIRDVFEQAGDDYGLALYWLSVAWVAWGQVRCAETQRACELALSYLERAGSLHGHLADLVRTRLAPTYLFGPTHVDEAIERVRAIIESGSGQVALAFDRAILGRLHALRGEFGLARELAHGARRAYEDAGMLLLAGSISMAESQIEWVAGDLLAAERSLRNGLELLEQIEDRAFHATVALHLADVYHVLGRYDEARDLCERARKTTEEDDVINFVMLDAIEGSLLAREGRLEEAIARGRRALELTRGTDGQLALNIAHRYLAETLFLAGERAEAASVAAEGLAIHEAKGDATGAARTRELFARLGLEVVRA